MGFGRAFRGRFDAALREQVTAIADVSRQSLSERRSDSPQEAVTPQASPPAALATVTQTQTVESPELPIRFTGAAQAAQVDPFDSVLSSLTTQAQAATQVRAVPATKRIPNAVYYLSAGIRLLAVIQRTKK